MKRIFQFTLAILLMTSFCVEINAQQTSANAPSNLTATQSSWQNFAFVKLQWQYTATMGFRDHAFFNVYRKDGAVSDSGMFNKKYSHVSMEDMEDNANGMFKWNDMDVQKGATYSYYVTAININGESSPSDTIQITIDSSAAAKATLTGTLANSSDGSAIDSAKISLIPVFGWGVMTTRTDSNGNFTFHALAGNYIVLASAEGFKAEYYEDAFKIFEAEKIELNASDSLHIDMSLQPRTIPAQYMLSGTVEDSLGNPVRAKIEIYSVIHNSFCFKYRKAETDSAGNYSVPVRQGDTVVVYANSKDKDYYSQFYNNESSFLTADRIGIDSNVTDINFVMQHKLVYQNGISGTVMGTDSVGVSSIVFAIKLGSKANHEDEDHKYQRYSTNTDSLGTYSFTNLEPGSYILQAIPMDGYIPTFFKYDGTQTLRWKNADSVTVTSSSLISDINFTVISHADSGAATVSGQVKDDSGKALNGVLVTATNNNQEVYSFGITNQNGQYTITGLVPGSYSISTDLYGYSSSQSSTTSLNYTTSYNSTASFTMTPENVTSVTNNNSSVVKNFVLEQNYPNPFNPTTTISYKLPYSSKVVLKVFNILGKEVATLVNSQETAGLHQVEFNASNLASGVYFYQINAGKFVATKKLILLK